MAPKKQQKPTGPPPPTDFEKSLEVINKLETDFNTTNNDLKTQITDHSSKILNNEQNIQFLMEVVSNILSNNIDNNIKDIYQLKNLIKDHTEQYIENNIKQEKCSFKTYEHDTLIDESARKIVKNQYKFYKYKKHTDAILFKNYEGIFSKYDDVIENMQNNIAILKDQFYDLNKKGTEDYKLFIQKIEDLSIKHEFKFEYDHLLKLKEETSYYINIIESNKNNLQKNFLKNNGEFKGNLGKLRDGFKEKYQPKSVNQSKAKLLSSAVKYDQHTPRGNDQNKNQLHREYIMSYMEYIYKILSEQTRYIENLQFQHQTQQYPNLKQCRSEVKFNISGGMNSMGKSPSPGRRPETATGQSQRAIGATDRPMSARSDYDPNNFFNKQRLG